MTRWAAILMVFSVTGFPSVLRAADDSEMEFTVTDTVLLDLLERGEAEREQRIEQLKEYIEIARREGASRKNSNWKKDRRAKWANEIRELKAARREYLPTIALADGSIGTPRFPLKWARRISASDIGAAEVDLSRTYIESTPEARTSNDIQVIQVLNENAMLVQPGCHDSNAPMFLLRDSTAGIADGNCRQMDGCYRVFGNYTYASVDGGSNTVLVLSRINVSPNDLKDAWIRERERKREERKKARDNG